VFELITARWRASIFIFHRACLSHPTRNVTILRYR
jgi:hypothetical protein